MIKVDDTNCWGCGACAGNCPTGAATLVNDKVQINTEDCIECDVCVDSCQSNCITIIKENKNA